jgi:hypothetical protein
LTALVSPPALPAKKSDKGLKCVAGGADTSIATETCFREGTAVETTTTVDIATAANDQANAAVEDLLKRDQGMFDSSEVLSVLDLVDTVTSLATDADPAKLADLAAVSAAGREKASGQPLLDAAATKGGLLLDLWAGLESIR